MEEIAAENGIETEFFRSNKKFRQEKRCKCCWTSEEIVGILSATEPCA
jgi:hypothetical protein